jgi:acetamidase/formamidase
MAHHILELAQATLHGRFSREFPPVLRIDPGDTVQFRTLDAGWGLKPPNLDGSSRAKFARPAGHDGHALCGPVAIRGARPGATLEVQIDRIELGAWGWTVAGGWPSALNQRLGLADAPDLLLRWQLDPHTLTGRDQHGHTVGLRPFMGVMGMPPDEPGTHSTTPPRICGGNIDCKELVVGSSLFLPIPVQDALFSVGDGHAVQGDGEVSGVAIECPMQRVDLTFQLHNDLRLTAPRARTPAGWLTFGFHEDLNEATVIALEAMLDLMCEQHGLQCQAALALASLVVDLRITQIVNSVCGVHALLPHGALGAS